MNVALYSRVSTTKQEFDRQVNELRQLCKRNSWKIVAEHSEKISGMKKVEERPELSALVNKLKSKDNKIQKVLVWEISRLGRKALQVKQTLEDISDLGVSVYIKNIGIETLNSDGTRNPIASLIISIIAEIAQMERDDLLARIKSGLMESARKGRVGGGASLPYGFKKGANKQMVIDENEALVVREMYNMSLQGKGTRVIANYLNSKSIPTRGNKSYKKFKHDIDNNPKNIKWAGNTVLGILKNPLYKGERTFKKESLMVEAIVDVIVWESVQNNLRNNFNFNSRNTRHFYLLKDILKCGKCGRNYTGKRRSDMSDNFYQCSSRLKKAGGCGNEGVNIDEIESALWEALIVNTPLLLEIKNSIKTEDSKKAKNQLEQDIELISKENAKLRREIGNLIELGAEEIDSIQVVRKEIRKREQLLSENEELIKQSRVKLHNIAIKDSQKAEWDKLRETVASLNSSKIERRDLLLKVIEKIEIDVKARKNAYCKVFFYVSDEPIEFIIDFEKKEIHRRTISKGNGKSQRKGITIEYYSPFPYEIKLSDK